MATPFQQSTRFIFIVRAFVVIILGFQLLLHLFWLPVSTQVGQLAIPWLMNQGMTLYGTVIENRPPLVSLVSALAFRVSTLDPAITLKILNVACILLISWLIYRFATFLANNNSLAGCAALLVWFLWEPVYGNILFYFDVALGGMLALIAYLAVRYDGERSTSFIIGLLCGAATLLKQHAWAAVIVYGVWLFFMHRRGFILFITGVVIFPAGTLVVTALQGTLQSYIYWNFEFHLFSGIPHGQPLTGNFVRKLLLTNVFGLPFILLALRSAAWRKMAITLLFWISGFATLVPNFGEVYAMAHLPLTAVISGVVVTELLISMPAINIKRSLTQIHSTVFILVGLLATVAIGWGWTIAATYVPNPLGIASIPAYDEFRAVAQILRQLSEPGDTLYVLPMLDGNSQIHTLANMLPPGTWVNGHPHILSVPGLLDKLLSEWEQNPPRYIVDFPTLRQQVGPVIQPLVDFMMRHYSEVSRVDDVPFNGDAVIYRLNQPLPQG